MALHKLKAAYSKEELEAYLLHERGHMNLIGRLMTAVYAVIMVFIVLFIYLVILFFDRGDYNFALRMILFIFLFLLLGWLLNCLREYYADYYSWIHCGRKPLISALRKIDKFKRSNWFNSMLRNYTHPPLATRIILIEKTRA